MQVDIFHRMFEFYTTSYTHFENRAEDILIYLEEMGDCVKKEIIQEDTLYTQECDMYHFESKVCKAMSGKNQGKKEGIISRLQKSRKRSYSPILLMQMYCFALCMHIGLVWTKEKSIV